jgi:hypothetical protein
MSSVTEEIQRLQLRILNLEKQQKEKDKCDETPSIDHNFNVTNNILTEKKTAINSNRYSKSDLLARYSKSDPLARYYHQEPCYSFRSNL